METALWQLHQLSGAQAHDHSSTQTIKDTCTHICDENSTHEQNNPSELQQRAILIFTSRCQVLNIAKKRTSLLPSVISLKLQPLDSDGCIFNLLIIKRQTENHLLQSFYRHLNYLHVNKLVF